MENCGPDLLFPTSVIPLIKESRGAIWESLVNDIISTEPDSLEITAFTLLMVRINNCIFCNTDSYRAIHGCPQCARQALHRFRGSDEDLVDLYVNAKSEVSEYLAKKNIGEK
jgi:hypothetical protein